MKTCFKCGIAKPLGEFYPHRMMADGHLNKCKDCAKKDVIRRYYSKHEEILEYEHRRQQTPGRRAKKYTYTKNHRKRHPLKNWARAVVARALKAGSIKRETCYICGSDNSQAHHEDYSKPLQVMWLCDYHHKELHRSKVA